MVQPSDDRVHYKSPMQERDKSTVMWRKLDRNIAHQHTTFVLRKTKLLYCGRKWACGPRGYCSYTSTFEVGMNRRTSISGRSRPHSKRAREKQPRACSKLSAGRSGAEICLRNKASSAAPIRPAFPCASPAPG